MLFYICAVMPFDFMLEYYIFPERRVFMKKIFCALLTLAVVVCCFSSCMKSAEAKAFEDKMNRLTSELSTLFTKSHELEVEIKE